MYRIKFGSCWTLVVPGIELLVAPAEIAVLLPTYLPSNLLVSCWVMHGRTNTCFFGLGTFLALASGASVSMGAYYLGEWVRTV
jgi:hypothetical protein